jgi:undecaprenyl-diphosphatase
VINRARIRAFDRAVDRTVDRVRGHRVVDRGMYLASEAGDWSRCWHAITAVRVVTGLDSPRQAAVRTALLGAESLLVNQGVKRVFRRTRPLGLDGPHPHGVRRPSTSSFPSGHASSAAFASILLMATVRSPVARAGIWLLAGTVSSSRVYVKAHHASDVVGGALTGAALGVVSRAAFREWIR